MEEESLSEFDRTPDRGRTEPLGRHAGCCLPTGQRQVSLYVTAYSCDESSGGGSLPASRARFGYVGWWNWIILSLKLTARN